MIKNSVIVTALFDIGRDLWKDYQQSYGTYLYWMNNILNIDSDFIIFTEEKFVETILPVSYTHLTLPTKRIV